MGKLYEEDLEKSIRTVYEKRQKNINNLSYWFPKIIDCGIAVPETIIIPITFKQFKWFISDNYSKDKIKKLSQYINKYITESKLKCKTKLFIKTGDFSNKFQFNTCKVENIENIGDNFLSIYYASMCVGAGPSTEIVAREFIESDASIKTIYDGMPLNTEFRAFYDFDKKEVLGVFNYWDKDTMINGLKYPAFHEDLKTFSSYSDIIERHFKKYKDEVLKLVAAAMKNVDLSGSWSADIMLSNGKFYLIDMATAETSYYWNKCHHQNKLLYPLITSIREKK